MARSVARDRRRAKLFLGGDVWPRPILQTSDGIARRYVLATLAAKGGGGESIPTTMQTSIAWGPFEFFFWSDAEATIPKAVPVGRWPYSDRPFAVTTESFYRTATPAAVQVACSAYTEYDGGSGTPVSAGTLYWRNGGMDCPYMPVYVAAEDPDYSGLPYDGQGMCELLAHAARSAEAQAKMGYNHSLNTAVSPVLIAAGTASTFVKALMKDGLTTPYASGDSWRHFDAFGAIDFVPEAPPAGAFAPSASLPMNHPDRTNYFVMDDADLTSIGPGRTLSTGMNNLATCQSTGSLATPFGTLSGMIHTDFHPFFGQDGEPLRRWMIAPAVRGSEGNYGENSGYSRDWGNVFAQEVAASLAQGASLDITQRRKLLQIGVQIYGLTANGWRGYSGAGQWSGYIQFPWLLGAHFHASRPGMWDMVLSIRSNELDQMFTVPADREGVAVTYGPRPVGGSNHDVNRRTWLTEHIGKIAFRFDHNNYRDDSIFPADYESESSWITASRVAINLALLRNLPGGTDGSQQMGEAFDFLCHYRDLAVPAIVGNSVMAPETRAYFDDCLSRGEFARAFYTSTPEDVTVPSGYESSSGALTTGATSFSWNMAGIGGDYRLPVTGYRQWYSLDRVQYIAVSSPGVNGTQSITPGVAHWIAWQRQNSLGWGPRSHNGYRLTTVADGNVAPLMRVTPTNPASGTPVWTVNPVICEAVYPAFWDYYHEPAASPVPIAEISSKTLVCGDGYATGDLTGSRTYQWQRDTTGTGSSYANISGATSKAYALTSSDFNASSTTLIRCINTIGGVSATSNVITVPQVTQTDALIARMAEAPPSALETALETFISGIVSAGYWDKLDGIWSALHTAQASTLNFKGSTYPLTYQGGMTDSDFTAYRGFTGDGVAKHLSTGIADSAAGINWTQNAAACGVYINQSGGGTASVLGLTSGSNLFLNPLISGSRRVRIHNTANVLVTASDRLGMTAAVRQSSNRAVAYNGSTAGAANTAAAAALGGTITILRATDAYSNDRFSFAFVGALSEAEYQDFYTNYALPFINSVAAM